MECWGLKPGRDTRTIDLRQVGRVAEQLVRQAVGDAGQQIEPAAARLIAERAGTDIVRLRGDLDRLLLYASGRPKITIADAQEIVSAEASQDDWAVTNAIQRATRRGVAAAGAGARVGRVSYMILGQLAWFVRERLDDPRRIPTAIDALFRTDVDLKSSGGDPRILLERLVVELCGQSGTKRPS